MAFGVFVGVVCLLGLLNQYDIINTGWAIANFSWFNFTLAVIMVFCFTFLLGKNILMIV